jgi:hypothetical protein
MTKLISILIILAVLYGGWNLFLYWDKVKSEKEIAKKEAAAAVITGDRLEGLPRQLESSLMAAQSQGATGLRNWLKTYGQLVQDPRKAWIELDYCQFVARDNPSEARRIFAEVKQRTPPDSLIWPRIRQLQATYE